MKSRTVPGRLLMGAVPAAVVPAAAVLTLTALAAACSSSGLTGADPDPGLQVADHAGIVFMTQNVVPQTMMAALYVGRVVKSEDGCLRLDTPEAPTAVWPKGFSASLAGEEVQVMDEVGEPVGKIGEEFKLPGGEVPVLSDAMGFDQDDRQAAESRCPGRYWIVGFMESGEADPSARDARW